MKLSNLWILALAAGILTACGGGSTPVASIAVSEKARPAGVSAAAASPASCKIPSYSGDQDNVMRAYIAYYGRPADTGGFAYWTNRVAAAGGSLNNIMAEFGTSKEFTDRYGTLGSSELVTNIYRQLFGRNPEAGGLAYYVGELNAGRKTLQSITLDVLFGASGSDATIVANRLAVAKSFTSGSGLQSNYLTEADGNAMAAILAGVQDDSTSANAACASFDAMLDARSGGLVKTFTVTKSSDSNNGSCGSDCSLREAVAAANAAGGRAGVILPAGTYTVTQGQLLITGQVHVHGATGTTAASVIIDGGEQNRLFALEDPKATLVLSKLTVRNGNSDYGGALLNKGTAILDRVTLTSNTALNGGAILNTGSLTGLALTLSGNQASSVSANTGFGGGLYNESGNFGLFASQLTSNTARFNGGAIYAAGSGTVVNTTLSSNQSGAIGGGIDTLGTMAIVGSTFSANTGNDGGGLSSRESSAKVTVTTSAFDDNMANGVDLGGGGAAFNYAGTLTIKDSTFKRNQAYGEGGGAIETNGTLHLANVSFDNNTAQMHTNPLPDSAPGFGGAILIIANSLVTMDAAQFTQNTAGNSGGAIYNDQNTQLTITNSQFTTNTAQGLFSGGGGYGGAIISEGNMSLSNCTLSSNTSKVAGGALSTKIGIATLSNSTISGNSSVNGGGIVAYSGTLTATDLVLSNNTSTQASAGLLNDLAQTTLTNAKISGNTAQTWGGGFSNNNTVGQVSLVGSSISGNTAPDGSAFVNFGTVNVRNSTLSGTCNNHKTVNNQGGNTSSCAL